MRVILVGGRGFVKSWRGRGTARAWRGGSRALQVPFDPGRPTQPWPDIPVFPEGLQFPNQIRVQLRGQPREEWHHLNIQHHWEAGTWSLKVDGAVGLTGLQRSGRIEPDRFECWLFGQEQGDCAFDDLLITPLAPDQLEAHASAGQLLRRTPAEPSGRSRPRVATGKQSLPRRHTALPKPAGQPTAPGEFDFHLKVVGGGLHIAEIDLKEKPEGQKRIALYSPGYDAAGQPLPLQVEIRSDAHLGEGVVLADLHWAITEAGDAQNGEPRPVLVHGDFSTGPTQLATVPSKWSNKPLSIQVTPHLIKAVRGR